MEHITLEEYGLSFIFRCFAEYEGTWIYAVLGLLTIIGILFCRQKKARYLFVWQLFVLLATVYNPILMNVLIQKMDFELEYYRFFWILPMPFLLSYGLIFWKDRMSAKWAKILLTAAVIAAVLVVNQDAISRFASFPLPQNVYKVEDDLLAIDTIIHENSKDEEPRVALPLEYNLQARQYDPSLRLTIERDKMLFYLGQTSVGSFSMENKRYRFQSYIMDVIYSGQNISPRRLKRALRKTRTEFLVAYKANAVHDTILEAGCIPVGETENAVVYMTKYGQNRNA